MAAELKSGPIGFVQFLFLELSIPRAIHLRRRRILQASASQQD